MTLFTQVTCNTQHLLHDLLPPQREQHYYLRERPHSYQLPDHASTLKDKNFLIRMLYKNLGCSQRDNDTNFSIFRVVSTAFFSVVLLNYVLLLTSVYAL